MTHHPQKIIMRILPPFTRKDVLALLSEFLATGIFIFTICCISINVSRSAIGMGGLIISGVGTALVAYAIIRTFGDWSGAHFNPAVTLGAMVGGKINVVLGVLYILIQCIAGIFALLLLKLMFPGDILTPLLLKPAADVSRLNALVTEFVLAFILVFVIYGTTMGVSSATTRTVTRDPESGEETTVLDEHALMLKKSAAAGAIAACLGFLCFLGTSSSGGAFNPVRATAPALDIEKNARRSMTAPIRMTIVVSGPSGRPPGPGA